MPKAPVYPDWLDIPSPEEEAVKMLLTPRSTERAVYADPSRQSMSDYQATQEKNWNDQQQDIARADYERLATLPTGMGQQMRSRAFQDALKRATYERDTGKLIEDLSKLDPGDPDGLAFQDEVIAKHPISREALKDPRVTGLLKRQASANAEMQQFFESDPRALEDYAALKASGVAPEEARKQVRTLASRRADRNWFAEHGGDPEEFDAGKFNDETGNPDRAKMAFALNQKKEQNKVSNLMSYEQRALDKALEDYNANLNLTPEGKASTFEAVRGKAPETEAEWNEAYTLSKQAASAQEQALADLVDDLRREGKTVPQRYLKALEKTQPEPQPSSERNLSSLIAPTAEPAASIQTASQAPIQVTTRAQYDALPSGSVYLDGSGRPFKKK